MSKIIVLNNRYVDGNNNSWDMGYESKESAKIKSESMSSCLSCSDCSDCSYCSGCNGCNGCRSCSGCSDCSDCSVDPQRYTTNKIGSRNSNITVYLDSKENVQVICGCFRGNLQEFKEKVQKVHTGKHLEDYMYQIEIMEYLINKTK